MLVFPPEVLARISPDLSLQRHLSLGVRPSLRGFTEFRDVGISDGNLSRHSVECKNKASNNIIGSNVLKTGNTFVVTTITASVVEEALVEKAGAEKGPARKEYGTVYPVVEVERGRVERGRGGVPTDEEMILSQRLHDAISASGLIPSEALEVVCGMRTLAPSGELKTMYPEDYDGDEEAAKILSLNDRRKWSYCLHAKIEVFSRDGPLFELCWNSLMYALQTVQLPRVYMDERAADLKIPIRTRGRNAMIKEAYDLKFDPLRSIVLDLNKNNIAYASGFGVTDLDNESRLEPGEDDMAVEVPEKILLVDLEGEAEEASIKSTLSLVTSPGGQLTTISLIGGGSRITLDLIKSSFQHAKERSKDLASKV
ncbi:AFR625Cp [Eremothecium gossypii ATCC 10895]|uniref:Ribosomal RNA-processing protein 43 n=1 Tax=Eremothecium gossypii (strain ATCC 10895 / CBS 109.51 / FGSC 9923 / NRRL Y-1056) TaxID=284811 RepID=Q752F1_EREGS|nr:AFR625Cp [Eremothecium gossypii ATCC 10895]AAS53996.2 AFR625Cp [Eremothecium gossypii ATCC 10895]AEY98310.1 FAFR625Cp [Eremothecium gossypii FDAG1]